MTPQDAPKWLADAVIEGIQALIVLRLRGSPAKDTVPALANLWIATITARPVAWDEAQDRPRIRQAFLRLMASTEHWPPPSAFLAALPAREQQPALMAPRAPEMSAKTRALLDGLLARMRGQRDGLNQRNPNRKD